ncbi:MAG TPA: hypothetical protein VNC50_10250 [Planctomycetia bacterium]|nr:hypothetical protein [Planctomycetia bacterium]
MIAGNWRSAATAAALAAFVGVAPAQQRGVDLKPANPAKAGAKAKTAPAGARLEPSGANDASVMVVLKLKHMEAHAALELVEQMVDQLPARLAVLNPQNALLYYGPPVHLESVRKTIEIADIPPVREATNAPDPTIKVFSLRNAAAHEVAELLQQIFRTSPGGAFGGGEAAGGGMGLGGLVPGGGEGGADAGGAPRLGGGGGATGSAPGLPGGAGGGGLGGNEGGSAGGSGGGGQAGSSTRGGFNPGSGPGTAAGRGSTSAGGDPRMGGGRGGVGRGGGMVGRGGMAGDGSGDAGMSGGAEGMGGGRGGAGGMMGGGMPGGAGMGGMMMGGMGAPLPEPFRIASDARTNSVIVQTSDSRLMMAAEALIMKLDQQTPAPTRAPVVESRDVILRLFWLRAEERALPGGAATDLPEDFAKTVVPELNRLGYVHLRNLGQSIVRLTLRRQPADLSSGGFGRKSEQNLDLSHSVKDGDSEYQLRLSGLVKLTDQPDIKLSLSAQRISAGQPERNARQSNQVASLASEISTPFGEYVVLGVSPTSGFTSIFVLQVQPVTGGK